RVGIRPLDPHDEARPTRRRLVALDLETGAFEVAAKQVGVADLLARLHRTVVDAGVADHLLGQRDDVARGLLAHRPEGKVSRRSRSTSLPARGRLARHDHATLVSTGEPRS